MKKNQITFHEIGVSKINHNEKTKKAPRHMFLFIYLF